MQIPLKHSNTGGKLTRGIATQPLEAYYCGMISSIYTIVNSNLGELNILVINRSNGDNWEASFNSASTPYHVLPITASSGIYEVIYTTETGEMYEGVFFIE